MLSSKTMELGLYATDELYISSKWPFWPASITIHSILVYRDARNSISYSLVIPFKAGVTYVVTTATQSFQQCDLESEAYLSYAAVTKCHFWSKFSKFYLKMRVVIVHRLKLDTEGPKEGLKHSSMALNAAKNHVVHFSH